MQQVADAVESWLRLRRLLRFAILCGDVVESGQDWQAWGPGGGFKIRSEGLDTNRRAEYWQVLKALLQLRSNDPLGHDLIRRHVGYHCEGERCRPPDEEWPTIGHWHQISLADVRSRTNQKQDVLIARREDAMRFVVEFVG